MFIGVASTQGLDRYMKEGAGECIVYAAVRDGAQLVTHPDTAFDSTALIKQTIKPPKGYKKA